MELNLIVKDLADALFAVDATGPIEGTFQPGIGPHTEDHTRDLALNYLKNIPEKKAFYQNAGTQKYPIGREKCDLVIPGQWAIELKLLRPFGDNNKEAEHWSNKIIHPYYGNKSAIGDVFKLKESGFSERKAIILFAYEHNIPKIDLTITLQAFEMIVQHICNIPLQPRIVEERKGLIHPTFQTLKIIGWEF